jgi:hypothetical protein
MLAKLQLARAALKDADGGDPLIIALGMLLCAYRCAVGSRSSRWQFAIELEEFQNAGIMKNELRWLLASGLALHAKEVFDPNGNCRKFSRLAKHSLPLGTCLVLSDNGVAELMKCISSEQQPSFNGKAVSLLSHVLTVGQSSEQGNVNRHISPQWDEVRKELRLGGLIVKQFRSPAPNQETILGSFQEELWPARIDDPLPPAAEQDSRRRLSDSIKYLNRSQLNVLIRFRGDGTGKGVLWELRE